jgi:hypothetical protein
MIARARRSHLMMLAQFVIDLLASCVFLMLLGWTFDLLAGLRRPGGASGTRQVRPYR